MLKAQSCNGNDVVSVFLGPRPKRYLYAKHMGKQKVGIDNAIWRRAKHMVCHWVDAALGGCGLW